MSESIKEQLSTQLKHKVDHKTKPIDALGRLESLAIQIGLAQNTLQPTLTNPHIIVFAGDHGIALEGVSAYPQEVTYQMVKNFLSGGAAINVFAKQNEINLKIVDAGVKGDFPNELALTNCKVGYGTNNFLRGKAINREQLEMCFLHANKIVDEIHLSGCNVIGFGEMGIGNSSAAAMLMSYLCSLPIEQCVGRGTGLNDQQLVKKVSILKKAQAFHGDISAPRTILQTFGGFEIAQMTAAMLAAHKRKMILLIDGFIASAAFLVAYKINPAIKQNAIFCHLSEEAGHRQLMEYFEAKPLLNLNMRLGEGTGCAIAFPIIKAAVNFLNQMASFESAGVSNKTKS